MCAFLPFSCVADCVKKFHYRGTIWLSTLGNSCQVLPSLSMGGCNLMDLDVWSHPSSMVMWAVPSQWLYSGPLQLRAWLLAQWRECLQDLSPFSIGPLSEMTSLGIKILVTQNGKRKKKKRKIYFYWLIFSRLQFFNMMYFPIPRHETCYQIALAIKDEVEDLEKASINVIQIDEAALREGLPLRKSEQAFYLDWAVHSFRITNCGVTDTTQVYYHFTP